MDAARIEASVLGGIRGDNDTFGAGGSVVENGALEGGLLWAFADNKRLARREGIGVISTVSRAGLAVRVLRWFLENGESL